MAGGHRLYSYVDNSNSFFDLFGLDCTIHHSLGDESNPFGHYSIEIEFNGKKLHTHQVITGPKSTTIIDSEKFAHTGISSSKTIDIPNLEKAMKYQESMLDQPLGAYDKMTNSCVTHVTEVLRQGGVDIANSPLSQMRFIKGLGI